jgi:hypothetical protein
VDWLPHLRYFLSCYESGETGFFGKLCDSTTRLGKALPPPFTIWFFRPFQGLVL